MSESVRLGLYLSVPVVPLLAALIMSHRTWSRLGSLLLPAAPVPGIALALLLPADSGTVDISWLLLGSRFGLDPTGRIFLLLFGLVWLGAGLYACSVAAEDRHFRRFGIFWLLTMSGNLGLTLAFDAVSFYCFFTLMSFAAYPLIIHDGSAPAGRAGKIYLIMVIVGEVLLFAALLLCAKAAGSLLFADITNALVATGQLTLIPALVLIAFGIKMGMVPLHFWLPLAHPAAPIPASAVLSGALIKAGFLGLLRIFPMSTVAMPGWSITLVGLGLFMVFFGIVAGLLQTGPKVLLAYSSISQIGWPLFGFGLALADPDLGPAAAPAIGYYLLHHGLAKGALFLGVGMTSGLAGSRPIKLLTLTGLLLPALALAGAPWTSGAPAKAALMTLLQQMPSFYATVGGITAAVAATGTTLLMGRFILLLLQNRTTDSDPPSSCRWAGWLLLLAAVGLCGTAPLFTAAVLHHSVDPAAALLPVVIGLIVTLLIGRRGRTGSGGDKLPPGDILILAESLAKPRLHRAAAGLSGWSRKVSLPTGLHRLHLPLLRLLQTAEHGLRRLSVAGLLLILLLLLLLLFL